MAEIKTEGTAPTSESESRPEGVGKKIKEPIKKNGISSGLIVGGIVILGIGLIIWAIVKYGLTGYWIPLFVGAGLIIAGIVLKILKK